MTNEAPGMTNRAPETAVCTAQTGTARSKGGEQIDVALLRRPRRFWKTVSDSSATLGMTNEGARNDKSGARNDKHGRPERQFEGALSLVIPLHFTCQPAPFYCHPKSVLLSSRAKPRDPKRWSAVTAIATATTRTPAPAPRPSGAHKRRPYKVADRFTSSPEVERIEVRARRRTTKIVVSNGGLTISPYALTLTLSRRTKERGLLRQAPRDAPTRGCVRPCHADTAPRPVWPACAHTRCTRTVPVPVTPAWPVYAVG